MNNRRGTNEVIGLIPCGGQANRIAPLPWSKELSPVGLQRSSDGSPRVKVVSHYLLDKMGRGGARKVFVILRKGKWDIPDYYGDGTGAGLDLGYLIAGRPYGPPYTLDQAYPFVKGAKILMGFPDIVFGPPDAYAMALQRLTDTRADLVLGLYRGRDTRLLDIPEVDRSGRVHDLTIRPERTKLKFTWVFAVWTSAFTEFMHRYLTVPRTASEQEGAALPAELTVGHVLQAAIREGLPTQSIAFRRHGYMDIGTPDGLQWASAGSAGRALGGEKSRAAFGVEGSTTMDQPAV
jgi:glucose-1-phosphate thymidylyltransferase